MCNKFTLIILKGYTKCSTFSSLLFQNVSEIFKKWIINIVLYFSINTVLRAFQNCFRLVLQHFQSKNQKKFCLFKCLQCQHYTVSRQHELMGNALTQVNTQLIRMPFIQHVSFSYKTNFFPWTMFPEIALLLYAGKLNCVKSSKYFSNKKVNRINCSVLLVKKNIIYLFIYCINMIARITLTSICGEGV
jgi:hypothetical protein